MPEKEEQKPTEGPRYARYDRSKAGLLWKSCEGDRYLRGDPAFKLAEIIDEMDPNMDDPFDFKEEELNG